MAKLYFKYGAMGSSKSAQALITKFNYEERGMKVWLIKPAADSRDGADKIHSRIGLEETADVILPGDDIFHLFQEGHGDVDVIISDECQFFTSEQIDQLRQLVDDRNIPVLNFGIRTDAFTHLFPGSRRLMEIADSIEELKTICACGRKAIVNARFSDGKIVTKGDQVFLGGNDSYIAMCHKCWKRRIAEEEGQIRLNL